jgi:poly(A) polymerase
LAYRIGVQEAIDRLLLHGMPGPDLKTLETWQRPRLPVSGGDLIAMGLTAGPLVAKTMQAIEAEWARDGFPADKAAVRAMARRHVDQALRSSQ